jgi:Ca2+-binding RTX toxin-like protein
MIEQLEPRRLYAGVSLKKGILTINGTDDADDLALTQIRQTEVTPTGNIRFVNHLDVRLNGEFLGNFSYIGITKVVVKLKGGSDLFAVGKKLLPFDIDGGEGDDTISGGLAGDIIRGGPGRNILTGGKGNDHFIVSSGGDILTGGLGNDTADFSPFTSALHITLDDVANDAETGRAGNVHSDIETIIGGGGPDFIDASVQPAARSVSILGGGGNDSIIGGNLEDTLRGGPGNDTLHGGDSNDYLNGDGGKDRLFGDAKDDTLNGGGPDPLFIPIPLFQPRFDLDTVGGGSDGSSDTLTGGPGVDVAIEDPFDVLRQL